MIDEGGVVLEKVHTRNNYEDMLMKLVVLEKLRWSFASLGLKKR